MLGSLAVLVVAACAATGREFKEPDAVEPPTLVPEEGGAPPETCSGQRCSRDLKKVLSSCDDSVIKECAAGLACGDGECRAPCEAVELSQGSVGCSFWTLPPDSATEGQQGSCFAALVANSWEQPVNITAEYGAEPLDISRSIYTANQENGQVTYTPVTGALPAGEVAIVFLAQRTSAKYACPVGVTPALAADPITHGTSLTKAFHLKADLPVTAYSIFPYGGAISQIPSATLLLPVSSWSESSILVNPSSGYVISGVSGTFTARTFVQIVADEDDTEVRIAPNTDISDGWGVTGTGTGTSKSWTLARGEVLQITQIPELSGSPIESNKRVGIFTGADCITYPTNIGFCDSIHQQIPGLPSWGHEYALVPYKSRVAGPEKGVPWRFVGAANGTKLVYDPAPPVGAPTTLETGQVVTFSTDQIVTVKSQDNEHPFYVGVYMTGAMHNAGTTNPASRTIGDPDFVNVVASDQFLDRYIFFTDHTYANTTLTFVRKKTASGFLPVELECAGEVTGFVPLGESGEYEYAWVELTKSFQPRSFAKGKCGYGRHAASSDGPFAVTVWGTDLDASYGYPGGMGLRPVTEVRATVPK
ncbi:MAG: IgGFc-binding protein [Labilithrix sp.]|nr:IgGFc-binding protein [Labilithrix sp.]